MKHKIPDKSLLEARLQELDHPDGIEVLKVDAINFKPHPFCIGTRHMQNADGILDERACRSAPCAFRNCNLGYDDHTHETAVFVGPVQEHQLLQEDHKEWRDTVLQPYLLKLKDLTEPYNKECLTAGRPMSAISGFAFSPRRPEPEKLSTGLFCPSLDEHGHPVRPIDTKFVNEVMRHWHGCYVDPRIPAKLRLKSDRLLIGCEDITAAGINTLDINLHAAVVWIRQWYPNYPAE